MDSCRYPVLKDKTGGILILYLIFINLEQIFILCGIPGQIFMASPETSSLPHSIHSVVLWGLLVAGNTPWIPFTFSLTLRGNPVTKSPLSLEKSC